MDDLRLNLLIDLNTSSNTCIGEGFNMDINPSLCCYYSTYVLEKHMSSSFKTIECIVVKWFSKLWGEHMHGWLTNTHYDATMQIIQIVYKACLVCNACNTRLVFICSDEIDEEYKSFVSLLNIKIVIIPTDQYGEIGYNTPVCQENGNSIKAV